MRSLLLALVFATAVSAANVVHAGEAHPWDATWAGGFDEGGDGAQLIVAGDAVIGFFYAGDYVDVSESEPIAADGSLTFRWDGGSATLSADGEKRVLTIHIDGAADRVIELKQDD